MECQGTELQGIAGPELREQNLKRYQEEMKEFTKFLKERFFRT